MPGFYMSLTVPSVTATIFVVAVNAGLLHSNLLMPARQTVLADDHFYHIFNRGVDKRKIFMNKKDYDTFLEILIYYLVHPNGSRCWIVSLQ